jgi:hypothetical protein
MRYLIPLLLFALPAAAAPRAVVLASIDGAAARRGPIEAQRGQTVTLYPAVRRGGRWFTSAPKVRGVSKRKLRALADLGPDLRISWRLVEPTPHHVETPPPNFGNPAYSNAVLFGRRHGTWLGYDTLEYEQREVAQSPSLVVKQAQPTHPKLVAQSRGLGTVRYSVALTAGAKAWASPGPEAVAQGGISPRVFRISYRGADDLVGWLESLYNVPNVFGSAGKGRAHQTDRHQGADCADVIVGAARKAGARIDYTSVSGLYRETTPRSERLFLDQDGLHRIEADGSHTPVVLRWGKDVQRGDLMLIKYKVADFTGRKWDHIGVLGDDAGTVGAFDVADPVLHIGYLYGLVSETAGSHGPAVVQFSRFKRRHQRALR